MGNLFIAIGTILFETMKIAESIHFWIELLFNFFLCEPENSYSNKGFPITN